MRILKRVKVPTGDILVVEGEYGPLECLSLGDYGKNVNIKANFLGLDRIPKKVVHTDLLPLTEKWVITISTQYGCSMGCKFCDVPKVGKGRNATFDDMVGQIEAAMSLHPEITSTSRLNVHFARMGEPTFNPEVIKVAEWMHANLNKDFHVHPVVSTMMPNANTQLSRFIRRWVETKNNLYKGEAGLQISINVTQEDYRQSMFGGTAHNLNTIARIMRGHSPIGRKFCLNFALSGDSEDTNGIKSWAIYDLFDPNKFVIKLTPMHKTRSCIDQGIFTEGDYTTYQPYSKTEDSFIRYGFDVLVFLASQEEDESRITCGNAILSDKDLMLV